MSSKIFFSWIIVFLIISTQNCEISIWLFALLLIMLSWNKLKFSSFWYSTIIAPISSDTFFHIFPSPHFISNPPPLTLHPFCLLLRHLFIPFLLFRIGILVSISFSSSYLLLQLFFHFILSPRLCIFCIGCAHLYVYLITTMSFEFPWLYFCWLYVLLFWDVLLVTLSLHRLTSIDISIF